MKVLFLDIDGVLNSEQSAIYYNRLNVENGGFNDFSCPIARSNLHSILEELPDLKIVVSSTWRLGETLESMRGVLAQLALIKPDRVIGMTPSLRGGKVRGDEIQAWLDANPGVERFVIVDDDSDMAHLMNSLVQTSWRHGLMRKDAVEIINRFYAPWVQASGHEVSLKREEKGLDRSVEKTEGQIKVTYWGKGEPVEASLEEWAEAKIMEGKPDRKGMGYRAFVK